MRVRGLIHWATTAPLLFEHYIRYFAILVLKTIQNNELISLEPGQNCLLYQVFHYISSKNNTKHNNLLHWNQTKLFVIWDLFISSFHCRLLQGTTRVFTQTNHLLSCSLMPPRYGGWRDDTFLKSDWSR